MKKLILTLFIIMLMPACASEDSMQLVGGVTFDWLTKSQLERDENISKIQDIIFNTEVETYTKKEFRATYSDHLKDKDAKKHYAEILAGKKENSTEKLAGFFTEKGHIMYAYGVQFKNDLKTIYYYDAYGNLRYVDKLSDEYPNFPYYSHQYDNAGNLVASIYFTAYDTQYVFKKSVFKGVWYKDTMYNSKAKKIMKRTNY